MLLMLQCVGSLANLGTFRLLHGGSDELESSDMYLKAIHDVAVWEMMPNDAVNCEAEGGSARIKI